MITKKEIDEINDIDSFIYFFKKNINVIDDMIEKCLWNMFSKDDLDNKNDREMIKIFINIMKKTGFKEVKLLFIILFSKKIKSTIDNIDSCDSNIDFYNIAVKKIVIFFINTIIHNYCIRYFREGEGDLIENLLKLFSEKFNSKMLYYIVEKVEKIQDNDNSIKYTYQNSYKSILFAYSKFMNTVSHYIKIIVMFINVHLSTIITNNFTLKVFLKSIAINIYYILVFNMTFRKCKVNIKNKKSNIENNVEAFFNNLYIIIEKNTISEELSKTSENIVENIIGEGIDEKYRYNKFSKSFIEKSSRFNLYETIASILLNNKLIYSETDHLKSCFENYVSHLIDFKVSLKDTNTFIEVLNIKPYNVETTIQWNINDIHEYLFTLENINLEYEYKNDEGHVVVNKILENVNINFEVGLSHIFIGNSGSGKTSILKAVMKRLKAASGEIKFLGIHDVYTYYSIRKYLTYMTSESALFYKDIFFNIIYGLDKNKVNNNKNKIMTTVVYYMTLFKLEDYIENIKTKNAMELSKGQTQKIAIIRLIISIIYNDVRILFLDEITTNIDNNMEKTIYTELRNLQKIYGFTIIYVSHNTSNVIFSDYNYKIDVDNKSVSKQKTVLSI
jgi:ABC-type multidrug transport system ATPase subunit